MTAPVSRNAVGRGAPPAGSPTQPRVAIPSSGRLRDGVLDLLAHAGVSTSGFRGAGARTTELGVEWIEMRPRDAAAWLKAGRIAAAFVSTDLVLEEDLEDHPAVPLGLAASDLVLAVREEDPRAGPQDMTGATVATHLPKATGKYFAEIGSAVRVVTMGGSLEGVCAAGLADGIVDLRQTGTSLTANRLRVLAELAACQALFVHGDEAGLDDLRLRLEAALEARTRRYVMLHLPPGRIGELSGVFSGLASPTVLPLAGREDLVAVHLVVPAAELWAKLGALRELGASGIVSLTPDAVLL